MGDYFRGGERLNMGGGGGGAAVFQNWFGWTMKQAYDNVKQ